MDSQPSQQIENNYSQSTQSATTISTPTSYTEPSNCENEPWGRLVFQKSKIRNLGMGKRPIHEPEDPSKDLKFGS